MNQFYKETGNIFNNFYNSKEINIFTTIKSISEKSPIQFLAENIGFKKLMIVSCLSILTFLNSSYNIDQINDVAQSEQYSYLNNALKKSDQIENFYIDYQNKKEEKINIIHLGEKEFLTKELENSSVLKDSISDSYEDFSLSLKDLKEPHPSNKKYFNQELIGKTPSIQEINEIASVYNIDGKLLYAMMLKESHGDPNAISNKAASGQFQFLYKTAEEFGLISEGKDLRSNGYAATDAAARYIAWLNIVINGKDADIKKEENYKYVLAAYNAGIHKVYFKGNKRIPRYTETLNYVKDITLLYSGKGYYVQRGDRLDLIAKKFNIEESLLKINNFYKLDKNSRLISGTILNIDSEYNLKYKVKKGDTAYKIAKRTGLTVDDIISANNQSTNLRIGQIIEFDFSDIKKSKKLNRNKV